MSGVEEVCDKIFNKIMEMRRNLLVNIFKMWINKLSNCDNFGLSRYNNHDNNIKIERHEIFPTLATTYATLSYKRRSSSNSPLIFIF